MKTVLVIAYHFPPIGGGGVQRTLKFIKYLQRYNYRPIIITPHPNLVRSHVYDYSLLNEIPTNIKILNTFILDLNWMFKILYGLKLIRLVNFINGTLLFPDYQIQWIPFAKREIKKIIKQQKIDIVFITSPPHSIQSLGTWIKRRFNLPVVNDLRDPLTYNFNKKSVCIFKKRYKYEKKILENSDFVIVVSSLMKKNYIQKFNINKNKVTIITNGYDEEDFHKIKIKIRGKNKIIFSHIGQLYSNHNAKSLLLAISKIQDKLTNVEFRFIGKITSEDKMLIKKLNLEKLITIIDYCPHHQALKYSLESDFLILMLPEDSEYCVTGKLFEYIYSNKRILAIVPKSGSCAEIIRSTKTGVVVSPNNIEKIANVILEFIKNHNKDDFDPDFEEIQKYERRILTQKLASIFDRVLENKYSNFGRDEIIKVM